MIKKRYMVFVFAVVSILLGSLLYNNLALAGKPQPKAYKDTAEIDVFGWATRQYASSGESREWGIWVERDYPAYLSFGFSPEQTPSNITGIALVLYCTGGIDSFTLSINGMQVPLGELRLPIDLLTTKLVQLDPALIPINEGINMLCLLGAGSGWLSVYKVSIFIEYEYQA